MEINSNTKLSFMITDLVCAVKLQKTRCPHDVLHGNNLFEIVWVGE